MGRIADALKRAEQERHQTIGQPTRRLQESGAAPVSDGGIISPTAPPAIVHPDEPRPLVKGLFESLVPFYERSSLVTEQYRSLRTRLLSQNPNYEHRVLAITSGVPKEGKSVTALNLGCILAEIRHLKVLVVDGDFRRSSLAKMLNQTETEAPGLADVLRNKGTLQEAIRETPIPNLSFIAAGKTGGQSAAELLTSARTSDVFQRLKNDFHYTIVDTPPATTVPDVGIIGQFCSGVIMIVRLHKTDEIAAKRAVRLLQVNNIPIVGCLLVGRDMSTGRYGYGYGYGYNYYRYYDYYSKGEKEESKS